MAGDSDSDVPQSAQDKAQQSERSQGCGIEGRAYDEVNQSRESSTDLSSCSNQMADANARLQDNDTLPTLSITDRSNSGIGEPSCGGEEKTASQGQKTASVDKAYGHEAKLNDSLTLELEAKPEGVHSASHGGDVTPSVERSGIGSESKLAGVTESARGSYGQQWAQSAQLQLDLGFSEVETKKLYGASLKENLFSQSKKTEESKTPEAALANVSEGAGSSLEQLAQAHQSSRLTADEHARYDQGLMGKGSQEFAEKMRRLFSSPEWEDAGTDERTKMLADTSNQFLRSHGLPPVNFASRQLSDSDGQYRPGEVTSDQRQIQKCGADLAATTAHELTHHEQAVLGIQSAVQNYQYGQPTFADFQALTDSPASFREAAMNAFQGHAGEAGLRRGEKINDDNFSRSGEQKALEESKQLRDISDSLVQAMLRSHPNEYLARVNEIEEHRERAVDGIISHNERNQYRARLEEKEAWETTERVKRAYIQ